MKRRLAYRAWVPVVVVVGLAAGLVVGRADAGAGVEMTVVAVTPSPRMVTAPVSAAIEITFDRDVDPATVTAESVWAFGRWSGSAAGVVTHAGATVRLVPTRPFSAGEMVTVYVAGTVTGLDGAPLRQGGYSFQYWTRAEPANLDFDEVQTLTTRTSPDVSSRAYGGIGSDLDHDGYLDITVVNEDTADLRVFLNKGTDTGTFDPFLLPPSPVGNRASPNEPTDFNGDGHVDICVANINDDTVSVLLGNGDGTFQPQQTIAVGDAPRGIAVLDVDGDGDIDFVNTNSAGAGSLSLHINDGQGLFGTPVTFEGGGSGEWALAAADMNEDGLLDLIVVARSSQTVIVQLSQGDGTFVVGSTSSSGGATWMLVCGDVNGDGHDDVVTVNSSNNHGSVLLGNGAGQVAAPVTYGTDSFPLATDLADLDGDGDLDWVTSSFGGDWRLFVNNGQGGFAFDQEFAAPQAASCSLPLDIDNDGDLDLALIDEIADVVIVLRNRGCPEDLDDSGSVDFGDLLSVLSSWGPCPDCPADLDHSGTVNFTDLLTILSNWGPCL